MGKIAINTAEAPEARPGIYNQAIVANGFVYCSGSLPVDATTGHIINGDIQTHTVRKAFYSAKCAVANFGAASVHQKSDRGAEGC